jgi:hypothetical protein
MGILDNVVAALKGAPSSIREIDKSLAKLRAEREVLTSKGTTRADYLAAHLRGLDANDADVAGRFSRWHTSAEAIRAWSGATYDANNLPSILGLSLTAPNFTTPAPTSSTPDIGVLTAVLRPQIESYVRKMVDAMPDETFAGGMPSAERNAKLARVNDKISGLEAQRAELVAGIQEAQRHLSGNVVPQGVSDHDVAREFAAYQREEAERAAREAAATAGVQQS